MPSWKAQATKLNTTSPITVSGERGWKIPPTSLNKLPAHLMCRQPKSGPDSIDRGVRTPPQPTSTLSLPSSPALTHQMLESLIHQHHHRQPDRNIGQPLSALDPFAQQQRHREQQYRLHIAQQPEQAERQQATGNDVTHQRRGTDKAQHGNQCIELWMPIQYGKALFAALYKPPGHRQHQRHIQPQPSQMISEIGRAS